MARTKVFIICSFLFFLISLLSIFTYSKSGIVPVACEMLFTEIEARRSSVDAAGRAPSARRATRSELSTGAEFQVTVSMLEIYNEQVFDLLASRDTGRRLALASDTRPGLRIRNHPQKGFYGAFLVIYVRYNAANTRILILTQYMYCLQLRT